jgi:hypothetical protein
MKGNAAFDAFCKDKVWMHSVGSQFRQSELAGGLFRASPEDRPAGVQYFQPPQRRSHK